jgi:hypothetical protein
MPVKHGSPLYSCWVFRLCVVHTKTKNMFTSPPRCHDETTIHRARSILYVPPSSSVLHRTFSWDCCCCMLHIVVILYTFDICHCIPYPIPSFFRYSQIVQLVMKLRYLSLTVALLIPCIQSQSHDRPYKSCLTVSVDWWSSIEGCTLLIPSLMALTYVCVFPWANPVGVYFLSCYVVFAMFVVVVGHPLLVILCTPIPGLSPASCLQSSSYLPHWGATLGITPSRHDPGTILWSVIYTLPLPHWDGFLTCSFVVAVLRLLQ